MKNPMKFTLIIGLLGGAVAANAQTIYSNNMTPGDYFTSASATPVSTPLTNFAGANGDVAVYREVKNNGAVGINTNLPRNGNGSLWFKTDGGSSEKSEFAISRGFDGSGNAAGVLGTFDTLSALSADMFTLSSPGSGNQNPILRVELFSATDNKFGQLIFDTAWTPSHSPTFTYNQWNSMDIFANPSSTWLRASGTINTTYGPGAVNNGERTLSDWQSILNGKGYVVTSINMGVGTWNVPYEGAIDNLSYGFTGGSSANYNFEAVPEPASMFALGLGALGLIRKRKAAKK